MKFSMIFFKNLKSKIFALLMYVSKEAHNNEEEYIKCDINDFIFIYIL